MWELIVVTTLHQQKLHSEGKICILNKKHKNNVAMQNYTITDKSENDLSRAEKDF
jgi:hypothetical protein